MTMRKPTLPSRTRKPLFHYESFERLDQATLLSARVQLDPSSTNRARLRAFLTLMVQRTLEENDSGP